MVKATVETVEDRENIRVVRIEVEPEEVNEYMDRAFVEIRSQVAIPGFRKGHVPRKIFENRFGVEPIWEEALENLVPEAYGEAVTDLELNPVAPPEVEIEDGGPGENFVFTATVEVMPEVELGQYRDLGFAVDVPEITSEDVDEALEDLRERRATAEVVEDEAAEVGPGMLAVVGFQGYLEGEPQDELTAEEEMLDIGSGQYLPGFEDGLLGAKAGETREIDIEIPTDAPSEDLAGREVTFEVEVKELKRKVLPELDDEFAGEVSEVESLQELRGELEEYLKDARVSAALQAFEQEVVDAVVAGTDFEIPDPMIQDLTDRRIEEMRSEAEGRGMGFDEYLLARGFASEEKAREALLEQAGPDLKASLVLDAVASKEEIEVTEEEFETELEKRAEAMGMDAGILRQLAMTTEFGRRLRSDLRIQKTRRLLAGWTDSRSTEAREDLETHRERRRQEARERAEVEAKAAAEESEEESFEVIEEEENSPRE